MVEGAPLHHLQRAAAMLRLPASEAVVLN